MEGWTHILGAKPYEGWAFMDESRQVEALQRNFCTGSSIYGWCENTLYFAKEELHRGEEDPEFVANVFPTKGEVKIYLNSLHVAEFLYPQQLMRHNVI